MRGMAADIRVFLSTPSARRATCRKRHPSTSNKFLSTPSARRATVFDLLSSPGFGYFYPRPPRGGRLRHPRCAFYFAHISIHALREEGDLLPVLLVTGSSYFYPRPPRGGRPPSSAPCDRLFIFLSTPSARRATPTTRPTQRPMKFLSTPSARRATIGKLFEYCLRYNFYPRPPRGGRLGFPIYIVPNNCISIHALREEGDFCADQHRFDHKGISIHALREEGDAAIAARRPPSNDFYPRPPRGGRRSCRKGWSTFGQFLSTPSARRATVRNSPQLSSAHISIHALREEGDPRRGCWYLDRRCISIHALREEGDIILRVYGFVNLTFLSTPSARRATLRAMPTLREIHHFYPRPPRGGRRWLARFFSGKERFLSTPSARRATQRRTVMMDMGIISIHALREEGDPGALCHVV